MSRLAVVAMLVAIVTTIGGCTGSVNDLQKNAWHWTGSITRTPAHQAVVPDPTRYTLTFLPANVVKIKADCNTIQGTYSLNGSSLTINASGPSTLVACGPDSLDQNFLRELHLVTSYETGTEPALKLTWERATGEMQFRAGS
jgi:heat shock protein HslJ